MKFGNILFYSVSYYYCLSSLNFFVCECSRVRNRCNFSWTCMHVGALDAHIFSNLIKTAITLTIYNICLSNLRYRCVWKLSTICYCQTSMKPHACMLVCDAHELRKVIKTALTFTIFNIAPSNLRYICILMLPTTLYCQISMKDLQVCDLVSDWLKQYLVWLQRFLTISYISCYY